MFLFLKKIKNNIDLEAYSSQEQKKHISVLTWKRGPDSNRRPSGYEPDKLPTVLPRNYNTIVSSFK